MARENRSTLRFRCVVPIVAGLPFLASGVLGVNAVGPQLLPIWLGLIGLISIAIGVHCGVFRIEYHNGRFTVYPGRKPYELKDIASWRLGEGSDAQPGYQRHLELGYDRWYRRYMLFEGDLALGEFDTLLERLRSRASRPA